MGPSGLSCFDPAALVKSSEGTFKASKIIQKYLDKHFKRCFSKEERETLFKEHPRPDAESCSVPQVDKFITDFLGKNIPKDSEGVLCKLQAATLASARPLVSAWQNLLGEGVQEEPDMMVPAAEVLAMIQRTLCFIGSASEQISWARRAKILEAIDLTWKKFSDKSFPSAKSTLFGEDFQSSLKDRVEKDTAISKALAISKKSRKEPAPATYTRREGRRPNCFFFEEALLESTEPGRAEVFSHTAHLFKENIQPAQAAEANYSQCRDLAGNPSTTSPGSPRTVTLLNINPHRGCPRHAGVPSKELSKFLGSYNGHDNSKERSKLPSRRTYSSVCQQLAQNLSGSLGKRDSYRTQARIDIHTCPMQNPRGGEYGASKGTSALKGSRRPCRQRGYYPMQRQQRCFFQSALPRPKVGQLMAAGHQSEGIQPVYPNPTLQDGVGEDCQGHYPEGRLATEVGSQGRVPVGPYTHRPLEVSEVPLGEQGMAVQGPAIRTQQCTSDVHEASEASCLHSQEIGYSPYSISGQHANNGPVQTRDKDTPSHDDGAAVCSGVHHQHEEKSVFTPARTIEFLGFIVDSTTMTIRLPQQKLAALRKMANQLLRQEKVTAR